ncbi:MAG: SDR family NAD(P)-dependent oxidoreductase [Paracoccaceae bacterium]
MTQALRFDGRVAIVTGAGGGLGRAHARLLAARGARVVVNDPGGAVDGTNAGSASGAMGAADKVVAEIRAAGGEAIADTGSVTDPEAVARMVESAMQAWGRIDILINNAGILRDKSFGKMTPDQFDAVIDVHLRGSWLCTQAVWPIMQAQGYGRLLFTTSSSGLYGNFGQANYSAAKMGLVGLMQTLHIEGAKHGIRANALAPAAATRMTEALLPEGAAERLTPESVATGALFLVSEDAPSKAILAAGAGVFAVARVVETPGIALPLDATPEDFAEAWPRIVAQAGAEPLEAAWAQTQKFLSTPQPKG